MQGVLRDYIHALATLITREAPFAFRYHQHMTPDTTQLPQERSFGVVPLRREGNRVLFLLIQHRAGHWAFPKGHASIGETELEAALRELREETGIQNVRLIPGLVVEEKYIKPMWGQPELRAEKTVRYFVGWVDDPTVRLQIAEVQDYRWLPYHEARALLTFEQSRSVLDQVARALNIA